MHHIKGVCKDDRPERNAKDYQPDKIDNSNFLVHGRPGYKCRGDEQKRDYKSPDKMGGFQNDAIGKEKEHHYHKSFHRHEEIVGGIVEL
jgi:hypothetical protein